MVSKNKVVKTESLCICGEGDTEHARKGYFENKCGSCGKEGVLNVESKDNIKLSGNNNENNNNGSDLDDTTKPKSLKIVCSKCGAEYCGQDGYDVGGGLRGSLTTVNPNEISDDDNDETSTAEEGETTYKSGWEGLCDLLSPLDGQAMMIQRGDYVIIKKIEMPQSAELWAYEGINVVHDSVTIKDYTPEIYNTFVVKWGASFENELEFVFEKHKSLFGERKIVVEAKKVVVAKDENEKDKNKNNNNKDNESDKKNNSEGGGWFDGLFGVSSDIDKNNNLDELENNTNEKDEAKTEEIPITSREEAIQFGLTEVGKAKREDGHSVELKVIGNRHFQMGEWCHVRLPSFNEDSYMFISKCNIESSPDSEYINSLTLVDYPPSLGKPTKKKSEDEENNEDSGSELESNNSTGESTDDNNANNNDSNNSNENNNNG